MEENELQVCSVDELIGSDDYREEPMLGAGDALMAASGPNCRISFKLQGPGNLQRMSMTTVESSDGFDMDVDRLYTWAPAPDQVTGLSVAEVEEFVHSVFRHSKSWMAAGIALRRVPFEDAQCIVKYVPNGQTRCGQGAAGCCSGPNNRRLIEMNKDVFGAHKGLMHELIHAFGRGHHNENGACPSVMGMSRPGIWPTRSDIASTRSWAHS